MRIKIDLLNKVKTTPISLLKSCPIFFLEAFWLFHAIDGEISFLKIIITISLNNCEAAVSFAIGRV